MVKVALVGAGSFVFGPSMFDQAILQHKLPDLELALVDVDPEILELMAGIARRMARETGVNTTITTHLERGPAFAGASFVIHSAARQIYRRFEMDCDIVDRYAPGHLITEFGGIQGICYSLRQIGLIEEIVADMKRHCPDAWLLDVANPLPRVTQAAQTLGAKTAGFCSVSSSGYGSVWKIFTGEDIRFPYAAAREKWDAKIGGLNHLCWITELKNRTTGEDDLPALRAKIASGATTGNPHSDALCVETGYLLVPGDEHTHDFFTPAPGARNRIRPAHGTPEERRLRLGRLRDIGDGILPWDELLEHSAWERPIDFVAAVAYNRPASLHSLNLLNADGQIPELPRHIFVESAATVDANGPHPAPFAIPDAVLGYCQRTALVTDTITRAGLEHKRSLVYEAVELDPTITDKAAGHIAIDQCLLAHADILPTYN